MIKNWTPFLQNVLSLVGTVRAANGDYLNSNEPFIKFVPQLQGAKKFLFLHIPEGLDTEFINKFVEGNVVLPSKTVGKILSVKQYENFREALIYLPLALYKNSSYKRYLERFNKVKMVQQCYVYLAIDAEHPLYEYIDPNNYIYSNFLMDSYGRLLTKIGKTGDAYQYVSVFNSEVKINDLLDQFILAPYKAKLRELSMLYQGLPDNTTVVNFKGINVAGKYITSDILFEVDYRTEHDLKNITRTELIQLSKINDAQDSVNQLLLNLTSLPDDGEIKLPSNLVLRKDRVAYAGQELYSDKITPEEFLFNTKICFPNFGIDKPDNKYIFTPLLKTVTLEDLNWDTYLDGFVKYQWILSTKKPGPIKLRIGTVDVNLEYKSESKFFYINDKRINKDEVPDVLLKALCSRTNEEYAQVLGIISKTSLEMHKFISEGLHIRVNLQSFPKEWGVDHLVKGLKDTYTDISFKIARDKNLNYIELDDKFVKIRNSRTLLDINKEVVHYTRLQEIFGPGTKTLESPINITNDAARLIEEARKRYLDAFKKSQLLLQEAADELGAKIQDWNGKKGVVLTGMSGTSYFIQASNIEDPLKGEPECKVYHYPSGNHICIIDKMGGGAQAGVDKLVARMYALRNDSVLAEHIHTLASYVRN